MLSESKERNLSVDGLRAIAALSVVLHHYTGGLFFTFGDPGRFGVMLFFIISGYCIVMSLQGAPTSGAEGVRQFLIRRAFRLYPPYWIAVAIALVWANYSFATVLANLTMLQPVFNAQWMNGVFWTLFIEVLFYAGVCVLLWFNAVSLKAFAWVWALLTLLALGASLLRLSGIWAPYGHFLFLSAFAMGGTVHLALRNGFHPPLLWAAVTAYLAVVAVISHNVFGSTMVGTETATGHFGNYAAAALIFLIGLRLQCFSWTWLSYLGRISYGIYLFHSDAYILIARLTDNKLHMAILALIIAIGFSAAIHHLVEQPCIRLGRKLAGKGRRPALAVT